MSGDTSVTLPHTQQQVPPQPTDGSTPNGGWPTSELQPTDLAMLSGMFGGMGGYGMGMPGMGMPYSPALGNFNAGVMSGNYITPGSSPYERANVSNVILSGKEHGLTRGINENKFITFAGAGSGVLGGALAGFKIGKGNGIATVIGGLVGGTVGFLGGNEAGNALQEYRVEQGGLRALAGDVIGSGDYKVGNNPVNLVNHI